MRQYRSAIFVAAVAVVFALAAVFVPGHREYTAMFAVVCAVVAGVAVLQTWPAAIAFIKLRARLLVVVGWSVCVLGCLAGLGLAFVVGAQRPTEMNLFLYGGLALAFLGFMATQLPRMARQIAQSRADLAALKAIERTPPAFDGLREGVEASLSVLRGGRAFLQIAGPWAAALAVAAYGFLVFSSAFAHSAGSAQQFLFGGLLLLLAAIYLIVPTVAVAWFRWSIDGQLPGRFLALPDRAALSFAWRLWFFLTMLGAADRIVTPQLTRLAAAVTPQHAGTVVGLAALAVDILIIAAAGGFALQLPAMAVNDGAFTQTAAMTEGRKLWPGLPVGLALSLATFPFLAWGCFGLFSELSRAAPQVHPGPAILSLLSAGALLAGLMVIFATIASGATLLSRAYLAAKARTAGALG